MSTNPPISSDSRPFPDFRAVAFDLDGLMFNTEDLYDEVLDAILQRRDLTFTKEIKLAMMGLPGIKAIAVLIDTCDLRDDPAALLAEAHNGVQDLLPEKLAPMPGLVELLDSLENRQIPKSIATSSSPQFAERALEISGLRQRFEFVLTADDVKNGKPHPDIYVESARRHQVQVEHMLVFEDSLVGSKAGAASGAYTIAVPGHHSQGQDFGHVDLVLDSLANRSLHQLIDQRLPITRHSK